MLIFKTKSLHALKVGVAHLWSWGWRTGASHNYQTLISMLCVRPSMETTKHARRPNQVAIGYCGNDTYFTQQLKMDHNMMQFGEHVLNHLMQERELVSTKRPTIQKLRQLPIFWLQIIHINMFPLLPWAINFVECSMLSAKAKLPLGLENIDKPKMRL